MGFTPNFTLSSYYVVDIGLPSSELAFGLINHDNHSSFSASEVFFGVPSDTTSGSLRNTEIMLYRQPPYDYDSMSMTYDRLDLDEALEKHLPIILSLEETDTNITDLIYYFNEACGLGLIDGEVVGGEIDTTVDVNTFAISPTSLAWRGSVQFTALAHGQSLMVDNLGEYMTVGDGFLLEITPPPTSE